MGPSTPSCMAVTDCHHSTDFVISSRQWVQLPTNIVTCHTWACHSIGTNVLSSCHNSGSDGKAQPWSRLALKSRKLRKMYTCIPSPPTICLNWKRWIIPWALHHHLISKHAVLKPVSPSIHAQEALFSSLQLAIYQEHLLLTPYSRCLLTGFRTRSTEWSLDFRTKYHKWTHVDSSTNQSN